jgi:hypothetical protein
MSDLKTMSTSKYYQQVRMHQFDFPRPTVKMKQQAQRILCHFSKRFFSCIVRKMRIAAGVSSPHDCHAVQHREHLIRLQHVIPSNCTPGKKRISHTIPSPQPHELSCFVSNNVPEEGVPHSYLDEGGGDVHGDR